MGILVECPKCKVRGSVKRKVCKCGNQVQKSNSKNYWIDYYINGKRTRERIGRSKQAAENRLREIQTAKAEGRHIKKNKNSLVTLGSLRDWYLNLDEVKELSSYPRLQVLTAHTVRLLGKNTIVSALKLGKVREYRKRRSNEFCIPYPGKHPSLTTINREISALKTMLNVAVRNEIIEENPVIHAKLLKEDNVCERVLTDEEFELLYEVAAIHLKPILLMAYYEPMRKEEILKLKWSEVDCSKSQWFIRLPANRTKDKKNARVLPLHPRVKEILVSLPSRFHHGRVFSYNGETFNSFKTSFKTALLRAGIEDFCFHDFRHCAVTNLRKAGNDYTTIMKASGHKTMSMFLRYNLVNEEDVAGMKWKDTDRDNQSISGSLKDMGLNPDVVLESLLLERGQNNKLGAYQK